jgi:adenylate kinase
VKRLVFLGPPGAGKGTQARELAQALGVPHVAPGDIFREAAASGTALGLEAKRYMDRGELVPDAVVIRMIGERLGRPDAKQGFILDGFPRTPEQATALDTLLADAGQSLDCAVFFDVPEDEIVRRLTGRRICAGCGTPYNVASWPPKVEGRCDRCGRELVQREDDREDTVRTRLSVYARQTAPVLEHYRKRGSMVTVTGAGTVDAVQRELRALAGVAA